MAMKILVCPSGFKGSLDPTEVADCIERGARKASPNAKIRKAPMFDGGEGTAQGLVMATGGELRHLRVRGPARTEVESFYGILGGGGPKTAIVEMAAAAGLSLVPTDMRDPTQTTSYGVGTLIRAALDDGVERVVIGCGDSGTSDAGIGACQALGARFFDAEARELPAEATSLGQIAEIDLDGLHPRLHDVIIDVACNWTNVLCGPKGVARVYGPQKGASPAQVDALAAGLDVFASAASRKMGKPIGLLPGSGASGGLGAGLLLLGAKLRPRYEVMSEYLRLDDLFEDCQLVITAEGAIDEQTLRGKIPTEISRRAKEHDLPVICLAGTIGEGASATYEAGIDTYASILQGPSTLQKATEDAKRLVEESAESLIRTIMIGKSLMPRDGGEPSQEETPPKSEEAPRIIRTMSLKTSKDEKFQTDVGQVMSQTSVRIV